MVELEDSACKRLLKQLSALLLGLLVAGCWHDDVNVEAECHGCLCVDELWSCDGDTVVSPDGTAVGLQAEAGFFELEPVCPRFEGKERCVEAARLFYVFQPADEAPAEKPLALLFNGGPNFATTAGLFAHNTARMTLVDGSAKPNVNSWTKLFNLLYVDARHAGFSYARAIEPSAATVPSADFVPELDAADVARVLLRFLARHPALRHGPVVVVAESYGGVRAAALLDLLLHHETLSEEDARHFDPALAASIERHFAPTNQVDEATVVAQFGHLVLIQPVVARQLQLDIQATLEPFAACLDTEYEVYHCDQPPWPDYCFGPATSALIVPGNLSQATGVDLSTVAWLMPDARQDALRLEEALDCPELKASADLVSAFGPLGPNDAYFRLWVNLANELAWGPDYGGKLLRAMRSVRTFVTNAAFDARVWAPAIPLTLATYDDLVTTVSHDTEPRDGVARPGWMRITYHPDDSELEPLVRELRFPYYDQSGHLVSADQPAALLADVATWLQAP